MCHWLLPWSPPPEPPAPCCPETPQPPPTALRAPPDPCCAPLVALGAKLLPGVLTTLIRRPLLGASPSIKCFRETLQQTWARSGHQP